MNLTSVFELCIANSEVVVESSILVAVMVTRRDNVKILFKHSLVPRQSNVDVARPSGLGLCTRGARVSTRLTLLPATRGQPRRHVAATTTWKHIAIRACQCLWAP